MWFILLIKFSTKFLWSHFLGLDPSVFIKDSSLIFHFEIIIIHGLKSSFFSISNVKVHRSLNAKNYRLQLTDFLIVDLKQELSQFLKSVEVFLKLEALTSIHTRYADSSETLKLISSQPRTKWCFHLNTIEKMFNPHLLL